MKPVPTWKAVLAMIAWQIYEWLNFKTMSIKLRFFLASMTAILAAVSFFQVNSYFADKHNINSVFIIVGVALALFAIFQFWTISKDAGTGPDDE